MKMAFVSVAVACALVAQVPSVAVAKAPLPVSHSMDEVPPCYTLEELVSFDTDASGDWSQAEWEAAGYSAMSFPMADQDASGAISWWEYSWFFYAICV